jgi:hypothetical protein
MVLYLGFPKDSGIDKSRFFYRPIMEYLGNWLNSCCKAAGQVNVNVVNRAMPEMTRGDALIYLVGDPVFSVIARVGAPASQCLAMGRTSGWQGQLITEVYVNNRLSFPIAATIYHELLHNRLNLAVDIHRTPNGNFTQAQVPFDPSGPNDADQRVMCQALQAVPLARQFQGGFSLPRAA